MMINSGRDVDIAGDMAYKEDYAVNSFFAIGHFDAEGHILSYLYHIMGCVFPGQKPYMTYCFSVTDETTGEFHQYSHAYPFDEVQIGKGDFRVATPKGYMSGTLDHLELKCEIDDAALDLHLEAVGYPLYNAETGKFNLGGVDMYEYSIPNYKSNGTIRIGDKEYGIRDGISWYDRQWEIPLPKNISIPVGTDVKAGNATASITWGWMDLNLDNGDVISAWFTTTETGEDCWATLMHPDGSQKMVRLNPVIATAADYWHSEASGLSYPMKYTIQIPELDADLTVKCSVKDQELYFPERADLNHYEGAAEIEGKYQGKPVKGYTYVELVGDWNEK